MTGKGVQSLIEFRDPVLRRSAFYWFRLRHKSDHHRLFAVAALRRARKAGW